MSPKDKANMIYHKFMLVNAESVELVTGEYEVLFSLSEDDAKKCAIIHVEELIKFTSSYINVYDSYEDFSPKEKWTEKEFYTKVLEELYKL
jgi:hypothetical protein